MDPVCIQIGPLTIHWYGVFMALGFLAGLVNWSRLARREGKDFNFCSDLLFWVMISGIVGARLAFVLADWEQYATAPGEILRLDKGGLVFYGGFIASTLAMYFYARRRRVPFLWLLDFVATSLPLAHAFGRIGCFLNGCCYGRPTTFRLAVRYPSRAGQGAYECAAWRDHVAQGLIPPDSPVSTAVHPVQLYEAALNLLLFGLLAWVYRRRPRHGAVAALYLAGYAILRFTLENLRGDQPHRVVHAGLSSAQWVSLGLLASAVGLAAWLKRHPRPTREHGESSE